MNSQKNQSIQSAINGMNIRTIYPSDIALRMLGDVKASFEHVIEENNRFREKIKEYEKIGYESVEIQKLKEREKELKEELLSARTRNMFSLDNSEEQAISEWRKQHNKERHPNAHFGAIGGELTYKFTPTSIGMIGEVFCICGEKFVFRSI